MSFWLCGFAFFFFGKSMESSDQSKVLQRKIWKIISTNFFFLLNLIQFIDVVAFIILME